MKKFFTFFGSTVMALFAFTVNAQMYISGNFNNYNPNGDSEWQLVAGDAEDEAENQYGLLVQINEDGPLSFNFINGFDYIVPANIYGSNYLATNMNVTFKNNEFVSAITTRETGDNQWTISDWTSGDYLEIYLDLDNNSIIIGCTTEGGTDSWYIRAAFNNYNPRNLAKYALEDGVQIPDGEGGFDTEVGAFYGEFKVPAGKFSFNLNGIVQGTSTIFVPEDSDNYEGTNQEVTFTDGTYIGRSIDAFNEEEKSMYWFNNTWEGGWISVLINPGNGTITIKDVTDLHPDEPQETNDLYISGSFNNNSPESDDTWQLSQNENDEDIYSKVFNITDSNFTFNFVYGNDYLAPSNTSGGDITDSNVNVEFINGSYTSPFSIGTGVFWSVSNWKSGEIEITVDMASLEVTISDPNFIASTPESVKLYLLGEFNDYTPSEEYILVEDNDRPNEFSITNVNIPTGQFTLNFQYGEEYFVPATINGDQIIAGEMSVEFDNGKFSSIFTKGESSIYWVDENWNGNIVDILVNLNENTVYIGYEAAEEDDYAVYISGAFNEYSPLDDPDLWTLYAMPDENGVYAGQFEAPEGEFSFNIFDSYGTVIIPADRETVSIVFEPSDDEEGMVVYTGTFGQADDEEDYYYYWTCPTWEGGEFVVLLDLNEGTITITASEDSTAVKALDKVSGANDAIYNLQGVKVDSNKLQPGIYIINGKKVLVK